MDKIKIVFILPSLKAGGAERVISTIARKLDKNIFVPTLVVLGNKKDAVYPIDGIDVVFLNRPRLLNSIRPLFYLIRQRKPHIVVGSIGHVNLLLSIKKLYFRKIIFVGREASIGSIMGKFSNSGKIKYWKLYENYYRFLDKTICQSKDMADQLLSNYTLSTEKVIIINNPVSDKLKQRITNINTENIRKIITIGRLSKEKGYDRTLKALSKIKTPFKYTIIGNGSLKDEIIQLASELNILDKINFIVYTDKIGVYLSESDLFVQGSYVEGFPNALLESCVVGTPGVAMNAPGGTKEIIQNGINGYLAENEDDFISKIEKALLKPDWNSEKIRSSVVKKFNQDIIISKYESLFTDLYKTLKTH